ncbi:hypothetical protein B7463_g6562, partial [Scytalidium lignicola]
MDATNELPSYEDVHLDSAPTVSDSRVYSLMTLTLDPSGLSIGPLPTEQPDMPVHYALSSSLLKVNLGSPPGFLSQPISKKKAWEFCIPVPLEGIDIRTAVDPIFTLGTSDEPTVTQHHLLQFYDAKWVSYESSADGEAIAFEKQGGEQSNGMPMLTLVKNLDEDTMDFLVSAWCVKLWEEVGRVARNQRRFSSGRRFSSAS